MSSTKALPRWVTPALTALIVVVALVALALLGMVIEELTTEELTPADRFRARMGLDYEDELGGCHVLDRVMEANILLHDGSEARALQGFLDFFARNNVSAEELDAMMVRCEELGAW